MKGEVVGVNSQIYSRSGGFMGISFAIPIDVAIDIQDQLKRTGRVSRGRIGVGIQEVTKELAESFALDKARGAVVNLVEKGSPAEQAGVEAGDVILSFDGKLVSNSNDLPRIVTATRPGTTAGMQVWRQGKVRELSVVVGETPEEKPVLKAANVQPAGQPANRLGLVVSELSVEQKRELKLAAGLLVEEIRGASVRSGLRPGDVVVALIAGGARNEVKGVDQFDQLLAAYETSAHVTLLVKRGERQSFVTIKGLTGEKAEN